MIPRGDGLDLEDKLGDKREEEGEADAAEARLASASSGDPALE